MSTETAPFSAPVPAPRLLDQLRRVARSFGHAETTVAAYAAWTCRYIFFHGKRHPRDLGLAEIGRFLEQVARTEKNPLPALEAARASLDFLYRRVLCQPLEELPRP